MIKEEFGIGDSVEEAKKQAIEKLNCGDADYKIEIIDDVKPKILGIFGGHPAKVRAYYEAPDVKAKAPTKKFNDKKPAPAKKPQSAKPAVAPKAPAVPKAPEEPKPQLNYIPLSEVEKTSPVVGSAEYLSRVLEKMGVTNLSIKVAEIENGSQLLIDGENLGVVIGRRGETLDALQYLASFSANANQSAGYYRIVLDIGNYREKREDTLKSLARRVCAQVARTGRSRSLEPMNPYERRIIHTEVQASNGVNSHSVGDGINRHVVVCPEGGYQRKNDNRGGRRPNGNGGRGGYNRDRKPSQNHVEAPQRQPKSDADGSAPLYGRIG